MTGRPSTRRALAEPTPSWGVGVLESHHAPDFKMESRRHAFLKVVYVLSGSGRIVLGTKSETFAARDLLVVPPRTPNHIVDDAGSPSSLYVLCVSPRCGWFDSQLVDRFRLGRQARSAEMANRAESLLRRLLFQQSHGGELAPLAMNADALRLLHLLLAAQPSGRRGAAVDDEADEVRRYAERLAGAFYEATTIDAAARSLGIPRRRFTRLFREATGETWLRFVHSRAVDHAARLLAETEAPIAAVAFECGFGDLSTFYRRFKSLRGCSPAEWRRRSGGRSKRSPR